MSRPSFVLRSIVAVGLMIGFYVLAAGISGGLLYLAYADMAYGRQIHPRVILGCGICAFMILKGCFFMSDSFEEPGPEVTEAQEPGLFALIRRVATKLQAKMPQHVYLVPDVNAFVAEVGGWMGIIGTRRILGVGVGMMNSVSTRQLEAVLAHEFGHYHGGDTRLGGFLYRTRGSIGRVVVNLGADSALSKPFEWYGTLFLRLTQAISRAQELTADEFSVKVAGKKAHLAALRGTAAGGMLYDQFLNGEVKTVLEEGFAPGNIYDGLRLYIANLGDAGALKDLDRWLQKRRTDPYDSHPALAERLAQGKQLAGPPLEDSLELARSVLKQPDRTEETMTRRFLDRVIHLDKAKPIRWEQVPELVYGAQLTRASTALARALGATKPDGTSSLVDALSREKRLDLARRIAPGAFEQSRPDAQDLAMKVVTHAAAGWVAAVLVRDFGYRYAAAPGRPITVVSPAGQSVDPFALVGPAAKNPAEAPFLRQKLQALGLAS
ncbi:MAG: M48 family metallopeptidase [Candidatus Wallbacteria bacterium]|nr:M48 family metallopeptidase [Candidatus Wallbacteria bacterium]